MKRQQFESLVGKVVCLDLVNRERPVGRVLEVTEDAVVLKDPHVFVPVPAGNTMQVQVLTYGAPLFEVKRLVVKFEHIIGRLDVQSQMEQAYVRQTSGLVTENKPSLIVPN